MDAGEQLVLRGRLVIVGKEPDGDSVRFVPDTPDLLRRLAGADRIRPSHDGSVQLRFDAIDAPELHYGAAAQPLGAEARDDLLARIGFTRVTYAGDNPTLVTAADPADGIRGAILSAMAEANGRPVSWVLAGDDGTLPADGAVLTADSALLDRTLNAELLADGIAYYTAYTSTLDAQRAQMRELARTAREKGYGVWAQDATAAFDLTGPASIGPGGRLVLPKLFRRCTDYLAAVAGGFSGGLPDWIRTVSADPHHDENDAVVLADGTRTHLADLLAQDGDRVTCTADPLEITFVEK